MFVSKFWRHGSKSRWEVSQDLLSLHAGVPCQLWAWPLRICVPPRLTVSVSAGHCGGVNMPDCSSDASVFAIAGFPPLQLSSLKGSRPNHTSYKKPCIKYLPFNEICMFFCTDQKTKHQRFNLLNIISVKAWHQLQLPGGTQRLHFIEGNESGVSVQEQGIQLLWSITISITIPINCDETKKKTNTLHRFGF